LSHQSVCWSFKHSWSI